MSAIFITGNSQGIGLGLSRFYLEQGDTVYGVSRSPCPLQSEQLHHSQIELAQLDTIVPGLDNLLPRSLRLVILNAGILGQIQDLTDTSMEEVHRVMDVNVWANKVIIDYLIQHHIDVEQIILMSSGASVNGNRGWGAYSISKASVNMMARLYAHEMPTTHITAYAPGIIHTRMQDYLCRDVDTGKFSSVQNLVDAYQTPAMPDIDTAAQRIAQSFPRCREFSSGSFVDIRQL